MPSSGYTAITFVANEQPTTAKWNLIGSNDASFNNGNGFEDGIIVNRHVAAGAVKGANLNLADIGVLASTTTTGNFTATTDIQSLSMVIPANCNRVLIIGSARLQAQNAALQDMQCWIDYDAGTTLSKTATVTSTASFQGAMGAIADTMAVTPGTTKVFKLRGVTSGGGLMNCGQRSFLIIPLYG